MNAIKTNYQEKKSIDGDFMDGLPKWLSDGSSGSGEVNTESTNGGRAVLSTGTVSGGRARINGKPINAAYDAISMHVNFAQGQSEGGQVIQIGLVDSNANNFIIHDLSKDIIRTRSNGSNSRVDTRMGTPKKILTTELLWDIYANQIIHRYQDTFAVQITDPSKMPDRTEEYHPFAMITSKDTSKRMDLYLYKIQLSYHNKLSI